jgi:hypothetical protein
MSHDVSSATDEADVSPMDLLLAKLSEQQAVINKQHEALKSVDEASYNRTANYSCNSSGSLSEHHAIARPHEALKSVEDATYLVATDYSRTSSGSSMLVSPGHEKLELPARAVSPVTPAEEDNTTPDPDEVLHLKLELEQARGKIARMDQELTQTRITKHSIEQVIGPASEADFPLNQQDELKHLNRPLDANVRGTLGRDSSWNSQEDARSDISDALSAGGFNRARAIWNDPIRQPYPATMADFQPPSNAFPHGAWLGRGFAPQFGEHTMPFGPPLGGFRNDHLMPEFDSAIFPPEDRRSSSRNNNRFSNRNPAAFPYAGSSSSYDALPSGSIGYGSVAGMAGGVAGTMNGSMGMGMGMGIGMGLGSSMGYQPQPIGTPLSPFAPEFTTTGEQWKNDVG